MKNNPSQNVVVRFAPSPTGFLHIGGVRGALFNHSFAKQHGGTYVLRIRDTDKERNREEWTEGLINDLAWLGLHHDVFAKQSERTELYKASLQKLIDSGHAYISKETPTEPGQRDEVIRFKNPNRVVEFEDIIVVPFLLTLPILEILLLHEAWKTLSIILQWLLMMEICISRMLFVVKSTFQILHDKFLFKKDLDYRFECMHTCHLYLLPINQNFQKKAW